MKILRCDYIYRSGGDIKTTPISFEVGKTYIATHVATQEGVGLSVFTKDGKRFDVHVDPKPPHPFRFDRDTVYRAWGIVERTCQHCWNTTTNKSAYFFQFVCNADIQILTDVECKQPWMTNPKYIIQFKSGGEWIDTGRLSNSIQYLYSEAEKLINSGYRWNAGVDRLIRIVSARPLEKSVRHSVLLETDSAAHHAIQALKKRNVTIPSERPPERVVGVDPAWSPSASVYTEWIEIPKDKVLVPNHHGFTLWCTLRETCHLWGHYGCSARICRLGINPATAKILLKENLVKTPRRHD